MPPHGNLRPFCKRNHDLQNGGRGKWPSGKTYCIECEKLRKHRRKEEGLDEGFDHPEKQGDGVLVARIKVQADAIKALQHKGDEMKATIECLREELAVAQTRLDAALTHAPKPVRTYHPGPGSVKTVRRDVPPSIHTLIAKIS